MSGGKFDYANDHACREIYGWDLSCDYGEEGFSQSKAAAKLNPLKDRQVSEIVWDVFCLLHSYDRAVCGDTDFEAYEDDVKRFKDKWLRASRTEINLRTTDDMINDLRSEVRKMVGAEDGE